MNTTMKTAGRMMQKIKNALALAAMVAALTRFGCGTSQAGQWVVDHYEWSGDFHSETHMASEITNSGPGGAAPKRIYEVVPQDVSSRYPGNQQSEEEPYWFAQVEWNPDHPQFTNKAHEVESPKESKANGKVTVHAVFKWQRDSEGDEPPDTLYIRQTGSVYASKGIRQWDGNHLGYDDVPYTGSYFEIEGSNGINKQDLQEQGSTGGGYYSRSYRSEGSEIKKLAAGADTVNGPTVELSGKIKLSEGWWSESFDTYGWGYVGFGYSAEPIEVSFMASTGDIFDYARSQPDEVTIGAYVGRGWKINPDDAAETPPHQFWSGPASYGLFAGIRGGNGYSLEPIYNPQTYTWENSGDGSLLPPPAYLTDAEKAPYDLDTSTAVKTFTHDLGEIDPTSGEAFVASAREFPKTTVVKGKLQPSGDGVEIPGKATINWEVPFGTVYELAVEYDFIAPTDEPMTPEELDAAIRAESDPEGNFDPLKLDEVDDLDSQMERINKAKTETPQNAGKAFKKVVSVVAWGFVERAIPGGARKSLTTIRVRELARRMKGKPLAAGESLLNRLNSGRRLAGKKPLRGKGKFTVTTKGTFGKAAPNQAPRQAPPSLTLEPDDDTGWEAPPEEDPEAEPGTQPPTQPENRPKREPDETKKDEEEEWGTTYLYRAVAEEELAYIYQFNDYGLAPSGGGKYFSFTRADAENFAKDPIKRGRFMSVTRVKVPKWVIALGHPFFDPGVGGEGQNALHFSDEVLMASVYPSIIGKIEVISHHDQRNP